MDSALASNGIYTRYNILCFEEREVRINILHYKMQCFADNIITSYRSEKSHNNYRPDIIKSAIQKYIRRSIYDKALYFTIEMDCFKLKEGGEKMRTNLLHRLMIIYLEDVALGNMLYDWKEIDDNIFTLLKRKRGSKNTKNRTVEECMDDVKRYAHILHLMCSCYHTRTPSFIRNRFKESESELNISTFEKALEEKDSNLVYECYINLWDKNQTRLMNIISKHRLLYSDIAYRWFLELKDLKESFICGLVVLVKYLYDKEIDVLQREELTDNYLSIVYDNVNGEKYNVDEWVYDKHTAIGRKQGSDTEYFRQISSVVIPEIILYKEWRDSYIGTDEIQKESELFKFVVRAQLNTAHHKPDTYYAIDRRNNKRVLIKGPYAEENRSAIELNQWKKQYIPELAYQDVESLYLEVSKDIKSALGSRNKLDKGWFLIFPDLGPENKPIIVKNSEKWKDTPISDYKMDVPVNKNTVKEIVLNLLYSSLFLIPDNAKRNYIYSQNRVYRIDEEGYNQKFNFPWSNADKDIIFKEIENNSEYYEQFVKRVGKSFKQILPFVYKRSKYNIKELIL